MDKNIEQLTKCLEPMPVEGLTKREYFAALAMQGMSKYVWDEGGPDEDDISQMSVKIADALIKALEEK